jgi:hypothetical protein
VIASVDTLSSQTSGQATREIQCIGMAATRFGTSSPRMSDRYVTTMTTSVNAVSCA